MEINPKYYKYAYWGVFLTSLVMFYPFLGQVHLFDWDEINFAEAAREMIVTGNYSTVQINYQPFWEKPPLFFWMQVLSMKVFGINEFAARFPNAVCGSLTLLLLVYLGKRIKNVQFGVIWAGLYLASALPQLYFKSGIIDPWFNLFIFSGIWLAYEYVIAYQFQNEKLKYTALSGVCIGLGVMTKGPVALLIFMLTGFIFWGLNKFRKIFSPRALFTFLLFFIITGGLWFFTEIANGRFYIVKDFINYQIRLLQTQDAGHGGPFFYHWVVLLVGCFPLSIPGIWGMFVKRDLNASNLQLHKLMMVLFWVVLLLFSLVKTKIIHYSSMCYFPLSFLAAHYVYLHWKSNASKAHNILLAAVGIILTLALTLAPWVGANLEFVLEKGWVNDPFAEANMQAQNHWNMADYLGGVVFLLGLLGYFKFSDYRKWFILGGSTAIAFTLTGALLVPKIENISQRAAIEFYESKQGEDCYVDTYEFVSYADLFYTRKMPPNNPNHSKLSWLLQGEVDKPIYMVVKITKKDEFINTYPYFNLLYEKNGFVFFVRSKPQTN